jgi:selenocysteine lyase/cysteine desulfurase
VTDIGRICRERGILYLVDAAQTAGALPIDVAEMNIDLLAFTGHKALLGPMGTGGLVIREGVDVRPLTRGGTGSNSEFEEQPGFLPDCLESGTLNAVGLAGLGAGVDFIMSTGLEKIRRDELNLTARLLEGLKKIPGLTIYGPSDLEDRTAVVSFTIEGLAPSEIGYILDEAFNIMVRVGLHCAPSSHRTIGTFPGGTVRMVPGYFNTADDIDFALDSLETISRRRAGS